MRRPRLFWQLLRSFSVVIVIALLVLTAYTRYAVRHFYIEQVKQQLAAQARLFETSYAEDIALRNGAAITAVCRNLTGASDARFTVVTADGVVLGDSREDPETMDNHGGRPEIKQALKGATGFSTRFSHTLQQPMMYVALPVRDGHQVVGVVRVSVPTTQIDAGLSRIMGRMVLAGMAVAVFAALVSLALSRSISKPLEEMTAHTRHFAQGDFSRRVPIPDAKELGGLADALNQMAQQLDEKMATIERQRIEVDTVFSSMVEGVVAVDTQEHIINLNQAAADLLGVDSVAARGRTIQEVVRHVDLQTFVREVIRRGEPVESDIVFYEREPKYLQAHGSLIRDAGEHVLGALIVLHDVTNLRKLENVRRDFVANVSHELKTPITTIKGFVETLLDGAMGEPENARRFLDIMAKHADRLAAIIDDLLSLSRLEQEKERSGSEFTEEKLADVVAAAVEVCSVQAQNKRITINVACPESIRCRLNPALIQQALTNLIDNAVKYSDEGGRIEMNVRADASGRVCMEVSDHGCGISAEHLPRLFERFYRVDKARSREFGGTGLGLAIVKHIAQAHQGGVDVNSTPGGGSRFTVWIPAGTAQGEESA